METDPQVTLTHREPQARDDRSLSVTDLDDSGEFKPGPLDEVRRDMANKMKAGKWKGAFTL